MDIWECALGFMDSQVLLTATELGIFDCLDDGCRTAGDVAAAAGLPEDSAERLLSMLCSMELVRANPDGTFENCPDAAKQLVKGSPGYIGELFHYVKNDLYPLWQFSKEALVEGEPQWKRLPGNETNSNKSIYTDQRSLQQFMDGMHAITYEAASEFASYAPELQEISNLTDVGGASGAFLIALAERFNGLRGTILDLEAVRPIAEEFVRNSGLENHIDFLSCDFWEEPIPPGADAYSLGFILHDWSTEQGSALLSKIAAVSRPGGRLIIGEYLLDDFKTGPRWVTRSNLNMLVAARGRERSAAEYIDWVKAFGFDLRQIYLTSKGKNFLVFEHRGGQSSSQKSRSNQ